MFVRDPYRKSLANSIKARDITLFHSAKISKNIFRLSLKDREKPPRITLVYFRIIANNHFCLFLKQYQEPLIFVLEKNTKNLLQYSEKPTKNHHEVILKNQ